MPNASTPTVSPHPILSSKYVEVIFNSSKNLRTNLFKALTNRPVKCLQCTYRFSFDRSLRDMRSKLKYYWICFTGFPDPSRTLSCEEPEDLLPFAVPWEWVPREPWASSILRCLGERQGPGSLLSPPSHRKMWPSKIVLGGWITPRISRGHLASQETKRQISRSYKHHGSGKSMSFKILVHKLHHFWDSLHMTCYSYSSWFSPALCGLLLRKRKGFLLKQNVIFTVEKFEEILFR